MLQAVGVNQIVQVRYMIAERTAFVAEGNAAICLELWCTYSGQPEGSKKTSVLSPSVLRRLPDGMRLEAQGLSIFICPPGVQGNVIRQLYKT